MKRLIVISGCLALLVAAASCVKKAVETDFPTPENAMVQASVSAVIADTKVSLSGVSPRWEAGDRIAVFTTDGTLCPAFTTSDSGTTATFSGTKPEGSTLAFAVYPYSAAVSASGSSYTISVPAEQDGSIGSAVMAASADGDVLRFSNLCSVIKLSVPASLGVRKIEVIGDNALSGSFTVSSSLAVTAPSSPSDAEKRVSVSSSSNLSGEVLIAVIPSSSKKLQMVLTNASGKAALVSNDLGSALAAGHIKNLGSVPTSLSFNEIALIGSSTGTQSYTSVSQPSKPQLTNGDFETWLDSGNLPYNWNSFQTAGGTWASLGYDSSNRQVGRSTDKRPGSSGNYSCMIWARKIFNVIAQGNLTTGRINAGSMSATGAENYNLTLRGQTSTVGGTANPFYMSFTGRPDSVAVWLKFTQTSTDSSHPYGKFEVVLHDDFDYIRGYAKESDKSHKIAEANNSAFTKCGWTRFAIPFTYSSDASPKYALACASTNAYPGGGKEGDYLYIDDIEMIYNLYNLRTDANGWATLCLGYDALVPSGATAYYVTEVKCGYASLKEIPSGTLIPKGTAVLVKGSASSVYAFNGREADVSGKDKASVSGNLLKGTLTSISRPGGTCRVLSSSESTSGMATFGAYTGSTIAANTAYLTQ